MTEYPFALLVQDNCPACERLKLMLTKPLRGKFDHLVHIVHRLAEPEYFTLLASQHAVSTTPALIHLPSGQMLKSSTLGEVQKFLSQT